MRFMSIGHCTLRDNPLLIFMRFDGSNVRRRGADTERANANASVAIDFIGSRGVEGMRAFTGALGMNFEWRAPGNRALDYSHCPPQD